MSERAHTGPEHPPPPIVWFIAMMFGDFHESPVMAFNSQFPSVAADAHS